MIQGSDHFKDYFKHDTEKFVLIGGVAVLLSLESIGQTGRKGTKDLDIVLIIEMLDKAFVEKFLK